MSCAVLTPLQTFLPTGPADRHTPDYVVPDGVLIQTEPPDDEHLLLETCRGVK